MKALILAGLVATCLIVANRAEAAMVIPSEATIYIEAGSGLDVYLTAALEQRHVPLTVTTDKSKADYEIEAGLRLIDLRNGEVVRAWPVDAKGALHTRRTADALAKHLADSLPRPAKHKFSLLSNLLSKNPALDF